MNEYCSKKSLKNNFNSKPGASTFYLKPLIPQTRNIKSNPESFSEIIPEAAEAVILISLEIKIILLGNKPVIIAKENLECM
jgi:hypothetical protein